MCTYLFKRGPVYCFRRSIPEHLWGIIGRQEFSKSLRTKDREAAKLILPHYVLTSNSELEAAQTAFDQMASAPVPSVAAPGVVAAWRRREQAEWEHQQATEEFFEEKDAAQAERRAARASYRRRLEQRLTLTTAELTPEEAAIKDMLADPTFDALIAKEQLAAYKTSLRTLARTKDLAVLEGPFRPTAAPVKVAGVALSALQDAYATAYGMKPGVAKERRASLQGLIGFLGHDDATRLTEDDVLGWRDMLASEKVRGGKARGMGTVRGRMAGVKAMLTWARQERKLLLNVADGIMVRVPRKAKLRERDFTDVEAMAILTASLLPAPERLAPENKLARRWIPWLCAYTGARVNELSQLRGQDVQEIDGVWTIRITPEAGTQKTDAARIVPLHPHVIEQGFLAAIRPKGEGAIFYDPSRQRVQSDDNRHIKKVGERLAQWVRVEVGITDPNVKPNHGWRHTFKTLAMTTEMPERIADAIQGHAPKTVGQTYGAPPVKTMADAIAKIPRFIVNGLPVTAEG